MTASTDIDRILAAWFDDAAPDAAPHDLVRDIASATASVARRPGWLVRGGWHVPAFGRAIPLRAVVALALAALLAAAGLLALGSRPRVPPPFGPARPGIFALSIGGDIIAMASDGTGLRSLTAGAAWDVNPVFSRDGTQLAFWSRSQTSSALSDLVVMAVDGSGRRLIAQAAFTSGGGPGDGNAVSWSPDGGSIAYAAGVGNGSQIYVAHADGSGVSAVGDPGLAGYGPAWSPDGTAIAFSGGTSDDTRGLYVMRSDGTEAHRISNVRRYADTLAPVWSPDGHRLMFTGDSGISTVWMIDADGSHEHLVDQDTYVGVPSWSPDGQWIAWLHASWDTSLQADYSITDSDGHRLTRYPHEGVHPGRAKYDGQSPSLGWSADGKRLIGVLTATDGTADRLIEIDPATGDSTIIPTPGLRSWVQQRLAP